MPLSISELQDIQSDAMAEDIDIDIGKMSMWSRTDAEKFFESGGTEEPAAASVAAAAEADTDGDGAALSAMLAGAGLAHLQDCMRDETRDGLVEMMQNDRAKLLPHLKSAGVAKLPERQKIRDLLRDFIAETYGVGAPILVCTYSAGMSPKHGRDLLQPWLSAASTAGLGDQVVLDHYYSPPYEVTYHSIA